MPKWMAWPGVLSPKQRTQATEECLDERNRGERTPVGYLVPDGQLWKHA